MRHAVATLIPAAVLFGASCHAESLPESVELHRAHFERERDALEQLTEALRSNATIDHVFLFRNADGVTEVRGSLSDAPDHPLAPDLQSAFSELLNAAEVGSVRQSESSSRLYLGPTTAGDLYWNSYFVRFVEARAVNTECASHLLSQPEGACEIQLSPHWWLTLSWFTQPQ